MPLRELWYRIRKPKRNDPPPAPLAPPPPSAFVYRDGVSVPPDVIRVIVHPSVRVLPPKVFKRCEQLEEVRLHDGLEEIGDEAFCKCVSLRRLDGRPAALRRIGHAAFMACWKLSVVELAGILKVERGAFAPGCDALRRIGIPPRAFVFRRGNCRLVTDGTVTRANDNEFVLIAPGCLTVLPDADLTKLGRSIRATANNGGGTEGDRLGRIRRVVCEEVRGEVSAVLGLAFWKARIDEAERARIAANDRHDNTGEGGKRVEGDAALTWEAREACRGAGKGKVIAQNVLPFLDGLWT